MSEKQPEALAIADSLEFHGRYGAEDEQQAALRRVKRNKEAATLLRTQHADIKRKDALLRQALDAMTYQGPMGPTRRQRRGVAVEAIRKELQ